MHDALGPDDVAAVCFSDRLMAEANTKRWYRASPAANDVDGHPGFPRRARTRRQHDGGRRQITNLVDGDRVVALHHELGAELAEVLNEVVGERVVIVDDENHSVVTARPRL